MNVTDQRLLVLSEGFFSWLMFFWAMQDSFLTKNVHSQMSCVVALISALQTTKYKFLMLVNLVVLNIKFYVFKQSFSIRTFLGAYFERCESCTENLLTRVLRLALKMPHSKVHNLLSHSLFSSLANLISFMSVLHTWKLRELSLIS